MSGIGEIASVHKILWGYLAFDMTQQELAEHLGITQPAVSQRFKKIVAKIAEIVVC